MVVSSQVSDCTSASSDFEKSKKMASQLENCISHMSEAYGSLRVQEEPAVRCLVDDCSWVGTYQDVLLHCKQCHADSVWWTGDKERQFKLEDITKDCYHVELVLAYGHLFWLHVKNDLKTNRLFAACQQIVTRNEDPHTKFMIRTELCDASGLNCISCSTETRPHTEDITKIFNNQNCVIRAHNRLASFINSDNSLTFTVNITKMYYYQ